MDGGSPHFQSVTAWKPRKLSNWTYSTSNAMIFVIFRNWKDELQKSTQNKHKPSLKIAIFKTFGKSYAVYGIYLFIQVIILRWVFSGRFLLCTEFNFFISNYSRTIHPVILAEYINYFEVSTNQSDPLMGWILASGVILIAFLNVLIYHHCCLGCQRIGMRVRIACCSLVYRKVRPDISFSYPISTFILL